MHVYLRKDESLDIIETHKVERNSLTMVEVIFAAANNYARNVETMGSQPRQFSL